MRPDFGARVCETTTTTSPQNLATPPALPRLPRRDRSATMRGVPCGVSLPLSIAEIGPMKATLFSLAVAAILLPCLYCHAQAPEPSRQGRSLSEWIERTKDPDSNVRQYAANMVREMGSAAKVAVPALIKLLHDKGRLASLPSKPWVPSALRPKRRPNVFLPSRNIFRHISRSSAVIS